jgi:hypothetical protein
LIINLFINQHNITKNNACGSRGSRREEAETEYVKLSQILKDASEGQCFGYLMKVSEITDLG